MIEDSPVETTADKLKASIESHGITRDQLVVKIRDAGASDPEAHLDRLYEDGKATAILAHAIVDLIVERTTSADPDEGKSDDDLMRDAFQALLRGDTKERDNIVGRLEARQRACEEQKVALAKAAAPFFPKQ